MTKPQYRITMNAYFYDDNGIYTNEQSTIVIEGQHLHWYLINNGKPLETGDIFHILSVQQLS